jgi:hypothetical protein
MDSRATPRRVWVYAPEHLLERYLNNVPFERHRWIVHEDVVSEFQLGTHTVQARLYQYPNGMQIFPTYCKSVLRLAEKISPGDLYIDLTRPPSKRTVPLLCRGPSLPFGDDEGFRW